MSDVTLDDERQLLGALLSDAGSLAETRKLLTGSEFRTSQHELIYKAVLRVAESHRVPDPLTVAAELAADLDSCGGSVYLHELRQGVITAANVGWHAERVAEAARRRAVGHGWDEFATTGNTDALRTALDALDAGAAAEPVTRRARVTWASNIEPVPVVWAWEESGAGRIPSGSLSIAAGREGTGKSSFGIWLAAQITRGTLPGAFHGTPRAVFYVAVEDSWKHTLVPRLLAAGADLSKVGRFDVIADDGDDVTLSLPHDNALLEHEVHRHDVALVVLDPIMSVIGERIDTHREREVRSALDPLAKLADRSGAVLLGIAHFNKGAGTDAASLITGSGAFKNVPRSVFGFARDESDDGPDRVMSQVKNSLGRDGLPSLGYTIETAYIPVKSGTAETGRFVFTGTSERSVADVLRDSRGGDDERAERTEAAAWLVDYLNCEGGTVNARDAIRDGKAAGFTEDAIKKARRRVKARSERQGFGRGSVVTWTIGAHIGAIGAGNQKPTPMAPMPTPMADEPRDESEEPSNQAVNRSVPSAQSERPTATHCTECRHTLTNSASVVPGLCRRCADDRQAAS